jgi:hypothetical protein
VVAEKYAAEIEAVRDELPDLEHVQVHDSEYESWLVRQSAVDPDPAIAAEDYFGIETALKACEIFGDAMYQGYGQTEVLPVAMLEPPRWFAKDVPGSQPLHAELQISDENNRLPSASSMAE